MACWLLKSEPDAFSWQQQIKHGVEPWTGIRNHQAKRNLQAMRSGDLAFFYHSGVGREIVGVVEVVREAYPDPTVEDGDWVCVDVQATGALSAPVKLAVIKATPELHGMTLLRQSRLSVVAVEQAHWDRICNMGGWRRS